MRYLLIACLLALAGCAGTSTEPAPDGSTTEGSATSTSTGPTTDDSAGQTGFPPAPQTSDGPIDPATSTAIDEWLDTVHTTDWEETGVDALVEDGDPRTTWIIADLLRFYQFGERADVLTAAFAELTGADPDPSEIAFVWATNHLLAWDLPAWDGYAAAKRQIFGGLEPTWDRFFAEDVGMDWRPVTWGGVAPDTRPLDDNGDCRCIPALDHPETTDAAGGDWYEDNRIVFGIVLNGESIALPKHQMEVHEMVHLTLGGRELGVPYCTLCGSAQAYLVDNVPTIDRAVLRTSGLLSRSNKLMYDLTTGSAIDTFTGEALTGSLAEAGVELEQVSVVASTWGDWKDAHPETRIIAEDGGLGRTYLEDPLQGRDDAGPIFPIGDVDPRLPTQEEVVGVITEEGTAIAFPVGDARSELVNEPIEFEGVTVRLDDSIRVYDSDGRELVSHRAFWFAWSQFHEGTLLWSPESD